MLSSLSVGMTSAALGPRRNGRSPSRRRRAHDPAVDQPTGLHQRSTSGCAVSPTAAHRAHAPTPGRHEPRRGFCGVIAATLPLIRRCVWSKLTDTCRNVFGGSASHLPSASRTATKVCLSPCRSSTGNKNEHHPERVSLTFTAATSIAGGNPESGCFSVGKLQ